MNVWKEAKFDEFAEKNATKFYAETMVPSVLDAGIYFRLLLLTTGYFEGIDSERWSALRAADSLGLSGVFKDGLDEQTPDHSTISGHRRLSDVESTRKCFSFHGFWVLRERVLITGKE